MSTNTIVVLTLGIAAFNACDRPQGIEPPEPNDGVPLVGPSSHDLANAPSLDLTLAMRLEGDDERFLLSQVPGVAVSDQSSLYVLDQSANRIVVVDSLGSPIMSIGGAGDGPGEFRRPSHLAVGDDTLLVIDQHGINRFLLDGTFLGRELIANPPDFENAGGGRLYPQSLAHTSEGVVVSFPPYRREQRDEVTRDTTTLHVLDPYTGASGGTIAHVVWPDMYPLGGGGMGWAWFSTRPSYAVTPQGLVYSTNVDGKDIDVVDLASGLARRIRLNAARVPIRESDLTSLQEVALQSIRSIGLDPASQTEREATLLALPHMKYWPIIGRLVPATTGEVLVERIDLDRNYVTSLEMETTWDLLRSDGGIVGRVTLPAGITPMLVTGNALIGVSHDSLDVPSIVRYRVSRPGPNDGGGG